MFHNSEHDCIYEPEGANDLQRILDIPEEAENKTPRISNYAQQTQSAPLGTARHGSSPSPPHRLDEAIPGAIAEAGPSVKKVLLPPSLLCSVQSIEKLEDKRKGSNKAGVEYRVEISCASYRKNSTNSTSTSSSRD